MARATRSTTQNQEKESLTTTTTTSTSQATTNRQKLGTKKRKRPSVQDSDEPASKQPRTDDVVIKDEQDMQDINPEPDNGQSNANPHSQYVGNIPLDSTDAQKILDVLEMIDTQGLLDRVFPLQSEASTSSQETYSLRTLLKESSRYPLHALRSAVQHLFPMSSHPRSKPSKPATKQRRFCEIALSLLDQASHHSLPFPFNLDSILSAITDGSEDDPKPSAPATIPPSSSPAKRKYALVQRLPSGDWWTSLNSDLASLPSNGVDIRNLPTGHAEFAAILPSPSAPTSVSTSTSIFSKSVTSTATSSVVPTLGSYNHKKTASQKAKLPEHRKASCGSFLDYGIYGSFAPTFDHDGTEIGRVELGEVLLAKEREQREREADRRAMIGSQAKIVEVMEDNPDVEMDELNREVVHVGTPKVPVDVDESLTGLLPSEDIASIKASLGSLELENAVQELLDRNRRALERLEELQTKRLMKDGGGSSTVEEGSEEWDTAQAILDSFVVLASLRPRTSGDDESKAPLLPSPNVLRKLYRTLPFAPSPGWHGTLPPTKATALHDDSTVKIKAGAVATAPTTTTATTTSAMPATTTSATPLPSAYAGYTYAGYANTPRPAASTTSYTFKANQTAAYYSNSYTLPGQQQSYYGATGQQPYAYASWYNYATPVTMATTAGGTNSGRGTPQPGTVTTPTAMPTSYSSFFAANSTPGATQQRTPAVANTVASKPYAAAGQTWTGGAYVAQGQQGQAVVPTLPAHLRSVAAQPVAGVSAPATPTPSGVPPGGYYAGYQPHP